MRTSIRLTETHSVRSESRGSLSISAQRKNIKNKRAQTSFSLLLLRPSNIVVTGHQLSLGAASC